MFCAISGAAPEDAVISTKSGHLFERRLVEKYIAVRSARRRAGGRARRTVATLTNSTASAPCLRARARARAAGDVPWYLTPARACVDRAGARQVPGDTAGAHCG